MDGWMVRWIDGWMDVCMMYSYNFFTCWCKFVCCFVLFLLYIFAIVSFGANNATAIAINEVCCMWQVELCMFICWFLYSLIEIIKNLNKNNFKKQKQKKKHTHTHTHTNTHRA